MPSSAAIGDYIPYPQAHTQVWPPPWGWNANPQQRCEHCFCEEVPAGMRKVPHKKCCNCGVFRAKGATL